MGIGAVVQYNLYKPLADQDWEEAGRILTSAKRFFRHLLYAIIVYIVILSLFLSERMSSQFDWFYTMPLVFAISLSYIMQYCFGMTYRQLLDADQVSFVRIIPQMIQILLNLAVCTVLVRMKASIQAVKLAASVVYSIQPLSVYFYCKRKYPGIRTDVQIVGEPIKQKWNGLAQHLAAVVLKDTDAVVLTLLSTLENVSVYAVYNLVIAGVETVIEALVNNFTAIFGELAARSEECELSAYFNTFEPIFHMILIAVFFCTGRLIVPFVAVYTSGITDANYIVPVYAVILTFAQWLCCARLPYHIVIKAAGRYRETQASAIAEAAINIIVSVVLVNRWGLTGVAAGTAAAMLFRSIYYWVYLRKNILYRPLRMVFQVYAQDIIVVLICLFCTWGFSIGEYTYFSWFKMAVCVFGISITVSFSVFTVMDKRVRKALQGLVTGRTKEKPFEEEH